MSLLLTSSITIAGILLGKFLFKKWFNHLTLYCLIMGGLVFFYELKLLPYPKLIPLTWFYLISSFLAFLFGILTFVAGKNLYSSRQLFLKKSAIFLPIFWDGGRAVKYCIIFFSLIGLFVAIHRWLILINLFGSFPAVLIHAGIVYSLNVHKEIKGILPVFSSFVYVAIFFSGIYTAYRKRFSFLSFFPFIGIVLKELTYFGRGEILLSLMEFLFSFFLFRHLLNDDSSQRFKFSKRNAVIASAILLSFLISVASFIRISRGHYESFAGASRSLNQLKENFIISPSVYLYVSSDVGVLNKYLQAGGENTGFGQNTFLIAYHFLARMGVMKDPSDFQKGYYIPMWTNTGTYIRELDADFGITGVIAVPYFLGLLITWLWFKFFETKNMFAFLFLVYLYLFVGFSFLVMVTRLNQWYISLFMIALCIPVLEKIATRIRN